MDAFVGRGFLQRNHYLELELSTQTGPNTDLWICNYAKSYPPYLGTIGKEWEIITSH
jgi:hypothetical protein